MRDKDGALVRFRPAGLLPELEARAGRGRPGRGAESLSLVARTDLERYYTVLADELARLDLSEAEWNLLRDALGGVAFLDRLSYRYLWHEVEDYITLGRSDQTRGVDGPHLVGRLRRARPGTLMAIVDAVERWRLAQTREGAAHEAAKQRKAR